MAERLLSPAQSGRKFTFTAASIRSAVAELDHLTGITLRDDKLTGFVLRKQSRDWVFSVEKSARGRTVRIALEPWTAETHNIAAIRANAAAEIAAITEGRHVPGSARHASLKTTDVAIRQTLGQALEVHQKANPRTRATTIDTYRRQLSAAFGLDRRIALITSDSLSAWYEARLDAGRKPAGLNSTLAALKAVWSSWSAQFEGDPPSGNPVKAMAGKGRKNLKAADAKETALAPEYVAPFVRAAMTEMRERGPDGVAAAAAAFTALTGLRIGDVLRLTRADVSDRAIRISGETTKGKADIVRPITPLMREVLDDRAEHAAGDRLFDVVDVRKAITRACIAAGSPSVTPHDLRRTFITMAAMANAPEMAVKLLVGHRPANITESYALAIRRELPAYAAQIETALTTDREPTSDETREWWQ